MSGAVLNVVRGSLRVSGAPHNIGEGHSAGVPYRSQRAIGALCSCRVPCTTVVDVIRHASTLGHNVGSMVRTGAEWDSPSSCACLDTARGRRTTIWGGRSVSWRLGQARSIGDRCPNTSIERCCRCWRSNCQRRPNKGCWRRFSSASTICQ